MQECGSPFVLSQIFLRRRCCSCNTDVSITPCGVQEFAYYQDLPCLAMLSESVHSGTRIRTLSVTWCHLNTSPRKMETLDQHRHRLQQSRAPAGGWDSITLSTTKLQTEVTPLLLTPKIFRFWTSASENTCFRFPNSHSLPVPPLASQTLSIALKSRFKLVHTTHSWCLQCSVTLLSDSTSHSLTQDMANLFFFPRTQKGSDPESRIIEPDPPDLLQSDDSYTV